MRRFVAGLAVATLGTGLLVTPPPAPSAAQPPASPRPGDVEVIPLGGNDPVVDAVLDPDGTYWGLHSSFGIRRIDPDGGTTLTPLAVTALSSDDGAPSWSDLVRGPDEALWAFSTSSDTAHRLDPDGSVQELSNPVAGPVRDVVTGPDATIWVLTDDTIHRLTSELEVAGTIEVHDSAGEMATDADDVWVVHGDGGLTRVGASGIEATTTLPTMTGANQIAVASTGTVTLATPDGRLAEVPTTGSPTIVDTGLGNVRDLAVGPDHRPWVAGPDELLRLTPSGPEYVPGGWENGGVGQGIEALTTGPGGQVWATTDWGLWRVAGDGTASFHPLGASDPGALGLGPDGRPWLAGALDGNVARVGDDDRVHGVTTLDGPWVLGGLATGAAGDVWITAQSDGNLARVTPDGSVSWFSTDGATTAWDLTSGPDGDLRVLPDESEVLHRVAVDGTTTAEPVAGIGGGPRRLLATPGGDLWVGGADLLVRLNPSGEIMQATIPPGETITDLAVGADGQVWVAGSPTLGVARVSPEGAVTPVPETDLGPTAALAAGPDGALWFVGGERDGGERIGRVGPDGTVSIHDAAGIGEPRRLVDGGDGHLWMHTTRPVRGAPAQLVRVAVGVVDIDVHLDRDQAHPGDPLDAHVTVAAAGPTSLTGIEVTGDDLPGCTGAVPDLAPGQTHTLDCTMAAPDAIGTIDLRATVSTTETAPKVATTALDVTEAPPRTCRGHPVTVDLARGQTPTPGDDVIAGTPGDDVIDAGAGHDLVCAGAGDDLVLGGRGRDELHGGPGADRLRGGRGTDTCHGGSGRDRSSGCERRTSAGR